MNIREINEELEIYDEKIRNDQEIWDRPGERDYSDFRDLIQLKIYKTLLEILRELRG